jgi:unsaturated rhamnogalacturonyl hydrolase
MDAESAEAIETWVKAGGVLLMMENDEEHADQAQFDRLSDQFGMHFNAITRNRTVNGDDSTALVKIPAGAGGIFHHAHVALMKGTCTISVSGAAKTVLTDRDHDGGNALMAMAHVGRGVVLGTVDPWLYNEFADGQKLPLGEDNFAAGQELTRWVLTETPSSR